MKKILAVLVATISLALGSYAMADNSDTNGAGCHVSAPGGYHCH